VLGSENAVLSTVLLLLLLPGCNTHNGDISLVGRLHTCSMFFPVSCPLCGSFCGVRHSAIPTAVIATVTLDHSPGGRGMWKPKGAGHSQHAFGSQASQLMLVEHWHALARG